MARSSSSAGKYSLSEEVSDQGVGAGINEAWPGLSASPQLSGAALSALSSTSAVTSTAAASSQSGSLASASTSAPAWLAQLKTVSIATDISAAIVNGTVTYSGLETLLADVAASLSSSKSTLTAQQLADLKTIAANLNNGVSTSAYLTSITNALINGNAENATWTGGNATSATLGNLAAGSSATQLSELIGKWFLGTDLPSSSVSMSGYSTFTVSYSTSSNAVFGSSGPSMNDINQGYLGDCYLLSSLAEVAYKNSNVISSMITSNGNGSYGVRFYVNGTSEYVTVNTALADGGTEFNYGSNIWASLVEKAYAELQAGGVVTGNSSYSYGNSWSTIGNGGAPEYALEEITGASAITDFSAYGNSWSCAVYNSSLACTSYKTGYATASVQAALVADLKAGDDLILSSNTTATDSKGYYTLISDHAMSIYGFDSATSMFMVRNPWGTESGQTWDTTFEVSLSTLLADGDTITADNIGGGGSTASAPTVTAQTATQTWKLGQKVSFTLASNTFTDPQGQTLTYKATLASGQALPSWLTFNAATETFSGTVPNTATGLSLKVTATDTSGLSASETFSVQTSASAPAVTAQTATQTWKLGQKVSFTLASNTFTDPQGETLTYKATLANGSALPSWLTFNAATDTFSGTVPNTATGLSLKVTATDTSGLSASETFSVQTSASAPTVTAQTAAQTWKLGQKVSLTLASNTFTDPQGETLTYKATLANGSALPSWLTFNAATDTFSGTVPNTATGLSIKVTATDTSGLSTSETFSVQTPASAPTVTAQTKSQTWTEGQKVSLTLASNTFTDPQGETLTYKATLSNGSALPSWLTFNAATDTFTGTAPKTAASLSIKMTATDTSGLSASETFSVSVASAASTLTHAIAAAGGATTSASSGFIRPVQGVEASHLFSPRI